VPRRIRVVWRNGDDIRSLGGIHGGRSVNGTAIDDNDKAESWYVLDLLLRRGLRYNACATDDAHFNPARHEQSARLGACEERVLEPESLVAALKDGHYYSSTGRRFSISKSPATQPFPFAVRRRLSLATGHGSLSQAVYGDGITRPRNSA